MVVPSVGSVDRLVEVGAFEESIDQFGLVVVIPGDFVVGVVGMLLVHLGFFVDGVGVLPGTAVIVAVVVEAVVVVVDTIIVVVVVVVVVIVDAVVVDIVVIEVVEVVVEVMAVLLSIF